MVNRRKIFSTFEAKAFRFCLVGFQDVIEDKEMNAFSIRRKAKAWAEIAAKYNKIPGVENRTSEQLRQFYKNQKKKMKKSQLTNGRIQIFVQSEVSPKLNASLIATEENLKPVGSMESLPIIKVSDHRKATDKINTSVTTQCEKSSDREESHEIIEVKSDDEAEYLKDFNVSELSCLNVPVSQFPEVPSQESLQSCSQQTQTVTRSTNAFNGIHTPSTIVNKGKHGKKNLLASSQDDSFTCDVEKQILIKQYDWDCERFSMEKEKSLIDTEKRLLEMKLMKEQLRMYELVNEKIEMSKGIQICININK